VKQLIFARICRSDGEADGGQSYVFYDNTKFCRGQRPDHFAEAVTSSGQGCEPAMEHKLGWAEIEDRCDPRHIPADVIDLKARPANPPNFFRKLPCCRLKAGTCSHTDRRVPDTCIFTCIFVIFVA
jgi:hypothetical protein